MSPTWDVGKADFPQSHELFLRADICTSKLFPVRPDLPESQQSAAVQTQ